MVVDFRGLPAIGEGVPKLGKKTIFPRADHIHATTGDADTVDLLHASSFLRSDAADTMEASSAGILLTVNQQGAGNIARFRDDGSDCLLIEKNRNIVITLGDTAGARTFAIKDSSGTIVFYVDSDGNLYLKGNVIKL